MRTCLMLFILDQSRFDKLDLTENKSPAISSFRVNLGYINTRRMSRKSFRLNFSD